MKEVMRLQEQQRQAHLSANAAAMVELFAEGFITCSNGKIATPTSAESLARFQAYFDQVTFLAWDDISPPQTWVAEDGSLATSIIHKHVHIRYQDENGTWMEEETTFVWQETYAPQQGQLRLASVVSTNTPSITRPAQC